MDAATLENLYVNPTLEALGNDVPEALRDLLDRRSPARFRDALTIGTRDLKAAFGNALDREFEAAIDAETKQLRARLDAVERLWIPLDEQDRHGTWKGFVAGFFSPETVVGVKIGSAIFPGVGSVIGGAIGGFVAGSKIDDESQRAAEAFNSAVMAYGAEIDDAVQRLVRMLPVSRRRSSISWLIAAGASAVLVLLGAWLAPHIGWR
jgi:hypothetical protein